MNRYTVTLVACFAIALFAGCATQTITSGTAAPLAVVSKSPAIVADFKATAANLQAAVTNGDLPATDQANSCMQTVLVQTGITPPAGTAPAKQYTVTNAGALSAGSIAYIKLTKAAAATATPLAVPASCEQLLGHLQVLGLQAAANPVGAVETIISALGQ